MVEEKKEERIHETSTESEATNSRTDVQAPMFSVSSYGPIGLSVAIVSSGNMEEAHRPPTSPARGYPALAKSDGGLSLVADAPLRSGEAKCGASMKDTPERESAPRLAAEQSPLHHEVSFGPRRSTMKLAATTLLPANAFYHCGLNHCKMVDLILLLSLL
jgi:hypothetical protein